MHLESQYEHADKCTSRGCVAACGKRQFEAWLEEPLLVADAREDARLRQRREAFMRGNIPA